LPPPHPRVRQTIQRDHPVNNILGAIEKGVTTQSRVAIFYEHYSFISSFESFKVAMQEELNNFKRNKVWSLVEKARQNIM
jgi:hypothetical protein